MGYQSKTYSLSDEVVAAIDKARKHGETPNRFLRRMLLTKSNQDLKAARKRRYCGSCGVELTSTDLQAGYCTNCKEKL